VKHPILERLPQILFFIGFEIGAVLAFTLYPQVYSNPPHAARNPLLIFLGGALVGLGTEWANGCTSGHGICGVARLSVRSIVAVGSFMCSLFVFVPLVNSFVL
jgi:uncharacterized membrane protein YedE/YeeE